MKFRKKPVIVDAVQWTCSNIEEIRDMGGDRQLFVDGPQLIIRTLEGDMYASNGDWIIRGTKGELYPCKPDIFQDIYEIV